MIEKDLGWTQVAVTGKGEPLLVAIATFVKYNLGIPRCCSTRVSMAIGNTDSKHDLTKLYTIFLAFHLFL